MLDSIAKVFKILNSDSNPWQIAFACALGFIVGISPFWSPHNLVFILLAFVLRIHLASFWITVACFAAIAYGLDPYSDQIGALLLNHPQLVSTWTELYQSDFWRFTRFNHTITLGSLVIGVVGLIPVAVFFRLLVGLYRSTLLNWVSRLKIMQVLKASKLYEKYQALQ